MYPGSHRGWKTGFHSKWRIFRVELLIYRRVTIMLIEATTSNKHRGKKGETSMDWMLVVWKPHQGPKMEPPGPTPKKKLNQLNPTELVSTLYPFFNVSDASIFVDVPDVFFCVQSLVASCTMDRSPSIILRLPKVYSHIFCNMFDEHPIFNGWKIFTGKPSRGF